MFKITGINRKVSSERFSNAEQTAGGIAVKVTNTNCNAVIAADGDSYTRGHFLLTNEESLQFDEFCQRVEQRILRDIGDAQAGLVAIEPKPEDERPKAAAASGAN